MYVYARITPGSPIYNANGSSSLQIIQTIEKIRILHNFNIKLCYLYRLLEATLPCCSDILYQESPNVCVSNFVILIKSALHQ